MPIFFLRPPSVEKGERGRTVQEKSTHQRFKSKSAEVKGGGEGRGAEGWKGGRRLLVKLKEGREYIFTHHIKTILSRDREREGAVYSLSPLTLRENESSEI